jgi:hypothetical protein
MLLRAGEKINRQKTLIYKAFFKMCGLARANFSLYSWKELSIYFDISLEVYVEICE